MQEAAEMMLSSFVRVFSFTPYTIVSSRCGNQNFLRSSIDVRLSLCLGRKEACAFQNDIYTQFTPRKLCRICFFVNSDFLAFYDDVFLIMIYFMSKIPLYAVIFQQICQHLCRSQIVDRYNIKLIILKHLTER